MFVEIAVAGVEVAVGARDPLLQDEDVRKLVVTVVESEKLGLVRHLERADDAVLLP
jgi:hypothetical protein